MADDPERLLQRYGYGDPRWLEPGDLTDSKLHPPAVNEFALPPKAPAEVRNDSTRPDAYVDKNVREFMPPTVFAGSYGLGRTLGTAYGDLRMGDYAGAAHALPEIAMAMAPMPGAKGPKLRPRELDKLGYYSQALEAAKAWPMEKGTPEQALAYLKKAGTKDAEIKATALDKYLAEQDGVITRQGLEDYLRKNRVQVNESKYAPEVFNVERGEDGAIMAGPFRSEADANSELRRYRNRYDYLVTSETPDGAKPAKWQEYALDTENPTYRESVLHLPNDGGARVQELNRRIADTLSEQSALGRESYRATPERKAEIEARASVLADEKHALTTEREQLLREAASKSFRSGHWDEPNVMAHARTSVQRDLQGRPVYLIDELQSDWGQKIREGGARDEAKIGELQKRQQDLSDQISAISFEAADALGPRYNNFVSSPTREQLMYLDAYPAHNLQASPEQKAAIAGYAEQLRKLQQDWNLATAELRTAEAGAPGHPLVNTTDQWTTTAIRRLLQDAAEKDAAGIALTPGQLQNERFNLSKQVGALRYDPQRGELQYVPGANSPRSEWGRDRNTEGDWRSVGPVVKPEELASYVGKETAEKLLAQPRAEDWHTMNPMDGEIGGSGMRYAYDQMYPKMLEKQLRKLDPEHPGRGQTHIVPSDFDPTGMVDIAGNLDRQSKKYRQWEEYSKDTPYGNPFHYFELTPRVKEEIKKGLPLFSLGALTTADLLRRYYGEEQ